MQVGLYGEAAVYSSDICLMPYIPKYKYIHNCILFIYELDSVDLVSSIIYLMQRFNLQQSV